MSTLNPAEATSPFVALRFDVVFFEQPLGDGATSAGGEVLLCKGSFSECSGLEATMEPKTINEGGRNYGVAQRVGRVTFAPVVLKRGLTSNRDLWKWFELVSGGASAYRLGATITLMGPDAPSGGEPETLRWRLSRCLPTKFRVPTLNASSTEVAVEELQIAHEGFQLMPRGA